MRALPEGWATRDAMTLDAAIAEMSVALSEFSQACAKTGRLIRK
jgi:hypothetical protein